MRLLVVSHKKSWPRADGAYVTVGGFGLQMAALSDLFDETTLLLPQWSPPAPATAAPLTGRNLRVQPLGVIPARGRRRQAAVLGRWGAVWRAVAAADCIHLPIPGDVGLLGLLAATAQRKPIFVRYCGPWGIWHSPLERLLQRWLTRLADDRLRIVWATGGGDAPPAPCNPAVQWIFSTTLDDATWQRLPQAQPWDGRSPLRLITVGRLTPVKNTDALIRATAVLRADGLPAQLAVVGGGPRLEALRDLAQELDAAEAVAFPGELAHADVLAALGQAHLFVFPSQFEGFPKALLEALACGLPAVATAVSVIPHLIGAHSGALLAQTDPPAIAAAVARLAADPAQLAELGRNARAVSRRYTLEAWSQLIGEHLTAAWGPLRRE